MRRTSLTTTNTLLPLLPLLLAAVAALGSEVALGPDCDGLNKTLPASRLQDILGDWVLVWSVSDDPEGKQLLGNLTSSHVELRLLDNNRTVSYNERNLFRDGTCNRYYNNMTVSQDSAHSDSFLSVVGTLSKNGSTDSVDVSADLVVFESCPDCLHVDYRGSVGHYLCIYRREGHHQDVEKLQASHDDHKKLASCVGLSNCTPFAYDGASDFCPKKSALEASS